MTVTVEAPVVINVAPEITAPAPSTRAAPNRSAIMPAMRSALRFLIRTSSGFRYERVTVQSFWCARPMAASV